MSEKEKPSPSTPLNRRRVVIHVIVQVLSLLVIYWGINFIAARHYSRMDATRDQRFTLSPTTIEFLRSLNTDVRIIVAYLPQDSLIYADVLGLVDEYKAMGKNRVKVEIVDIARNPSRAASLRADYDINLAQSSIILLHEKRTRIIPERAMMKVAGGMVTQFNGEIAITAALINLVEGKPRRIYVLDGFQSNEFQEAVLSEIKSQGGRQNIEADFFTLSTNSIPEDADAVVIASPRQDFTEAEMKSLEDYWARKNGALFISLDPDVNTARLNTFIRRHGIAPRADRLVRATRVPGQPLQKNFSVPVMLQDGSPITQQMSGMTMTLPGRSQSLALLKDEDFVKNQNIHLTPLLLAPGDFWGETDYMNEDVKRDQREDHHAPLYLGAAIERGVVDPNLRIDTQRMVVVSNPNILQGGAERQKVKSDFVMSSLNWLLDRTALSGVSPKEPARYAVQLTAGQDNTLGTIILWVLPGLVAGFGVFIWMLRRS